MSEPSETIERRLKTNLEEQLEQADWLQELLVGTGDQVLADVFNSAIWRLTKPLRTAKDSGVRLHGSGKVNQGGAGT